nr:uncharacterized protein CI109_004653 [Kwoniella shandongensis]KAA5526877.1 hypothetical protein CI109_004653 [Kwoniella shandongensis]
MSTRTFLRSSALTHARPFSSFTPSRFPANPTSSPNANADTANISRDKQGTGKSDSEHGGSAQGGQSLGGSGGPTEKSGLADPEVPKGEASQAKKGLNTGSSDSAARN